MDNKPKVKLEGADGNVFMIIGLVQRALRSAGQHQQAMIFAHKAFAAKSYDEVLAMACDICEVE